MFIRPAVAGDLVYIGSCSGSFYALDRVTGRHVWSYDASLDSQSPNFHGNVLFAGDLVVVGTDAIEQGSLYGFDRTTGELRWHQTASGGFPSDLATRGTHGYAVTMTGGVRCLDLRSGETLWTHASDGGDRLLRSGVVAIGTRVVVSLPSGRVFALDAGSGERIWHTRLPVRLNTSPLVVGEQLYVGDLEGGIHRLSVLDGTVLDTFETASPVYGSLLSAGGCLLALYGENTLACLDPETGDPRWSRETDSVWSSFQPLVLDEIVLVGEESGGIRALRLSDGTTTWTRRVKGEIKGLGFDDGALYVGTSQGRVYALDAAGLRERSSAGRGANDPRAVAAAYFNAVVNSDLDLADGLFARTSSVYETGTVEGPWKHYREHHLDPEIDAIESFGLTRKEPEIVGSDDGSVAFVAWPIEYTIVLSDERVIESRGTVTFLLVREEGRYRIRQLHWSSRRKPVTP